MKKYKTAASLLFVASFISTPAQTASNGPTQISITLTDADDDRASTQGVFGPGPGFNGQLLNDFHWTLDLDLDESKTISSILIEHQRSGEAWTTSSSRRYGKDLYPLVVYWGSTQLNEKYDDVMGPLLFGKTTLAIYGQIESQSFSGGRIFIEFLDGSVARASIPAADVSIIPLDRTGMSCTDSDHGAEYAKQGTIQYTTHGGEQFSYKDTCMSNGLVAEGMCGGTDLQGKQFVISHGICGHSCWEGACVGGTRAVDFEGDLDPLGAGWEFHFNTKRQRGIEYIQIISKPSTYTIESYFNEAFGGSNYPVEAYYNGDILSTGNGGNSHIFESGDHLITIRPAFEKSQFSGGHLWIVFTDGTRYERELSPF